MKRPTARLVIPTLAFTLGVVAVTLWLISPLQPQAKHRTQPLSRGEVEDRSAEPFVQTDESPRLYPVYQDGKTGFIDKTGSLVAPLRPLPFDIWDEFSDGMARIKVSTLERPSYCCKFGYINAAGKVVVEPQYWEAEDFSEGLAAVKMGDRWGYIDREGQAALAPRWLAADSFSEGLAAVYEEGIGQGYIDRTGQMVVRLRGATAPSEFHDGMASVKITPGDKFGYIDRTGRLAIEGPFDKAEDFSEGLALVLVGNKVKFIDTTGRVVLEPGMGVSAFSDGLARITVGDKAGYMDKTGRVVIAPQFSSAEDFTEGLAAVEVKGLWGYIDKTGRVVIKPRFGHAGKFTGGIAEVVVGLINADVPQTRAKSGYIDKAGKYVWRPSR